MTDKQAVESIVAEIAKSFSGAASTKDWTDRTIWFDAAPYACVGAEKASKVFDEAFGSLKSCDAQFFVNGTSALMYMESASRAYLCGGGLGRQNY